MSGASENTVSGKDKDSGSESATPPTSTPSTHKAAQLPQNVSSTSSSTPVGTTTTSNTNTGAPAKAGGVASSKNSVVDETVTKSSTNNPTSSTSTSSTSKTTSSNTVVGRREDNILEESPRGRFHKFDEILGRGGFKTVYKAYDSLEGCEVAWNVVRLSGVPEDEKKRIVNEVNLLYTLKHPNILEFRGTWVKSRDEIIFITEILGAGSLKQFIKKVKVIRWKVVKRWCTDILNGLLYLHTRDPPVIHRDLKCDNIFINGQRGDLRIGDLGLSRRKDMADKENTALTLAGTPAFMAPEFYTEHYDEKVDIYALGMCTLEMLTKEYPYIECSNTAQIMKLVMEGVLPRCLEDITLPSARDFITKCLAADPASRPCAEELSKHEFLKKGKEDDIEVKLGVPIDYKRKTSQVDSSSSTNGKVSPGIGNQSSSTTGSKSPSKTTSASTDNAATKPSVAVAPSAAKKQVEGKTTTASAVSSQPKQQILPSIQHDQEQQQPVPAKTTPQAMGVVKQPSQNSTVQTGEVQQSSAMQGHGTPQQPLSQMQLNNQQQYQQNQVPSNSQSQQQYHQQAPVQLPLSNLQPYQHQSQISPSQQHYQHSPNQVPNAGQQQQPQYQQSAQVPQNQHQQSNQPSTSQQQPAMMQYQHVDQQHLSHMHQPPLQSQQHQQQYHLRQGNMHQPSNGMNGQMVSGEYEIDHNFNQSNNEDLYKKSRGDSCDSAGSLVDLMNGTYVSSVNPPVNHQTSANSNSQSSMNQRMPSMNGQHVQQQQPMNNGGGSVMNYDMSNSMGTYSNTPNNDHQVHQHIQPPQPPQQQQLHHQQSQISSTSGTSGTENNEYDFSTNGFDYTIIPNQGVSAPDALQPEANQPSGAQADNTNYDRQHSDNGQHSGYSSGIKFDWLVKPASSNEVNVELEIPISDDMVIVSFPFDYTNDEPMMVAKEMCEAFEIPEQVEHITSILTGIRQNLVESNNEGDEASSATAALSSREHSGTEEDQVFDQQQSGSLATHEEGDLGDEEESQEDKEALEQAIKLGTRYDEGRLKRMEESIKAKEEMEETRRNNYLKDLNATQKKIDAQRKLLARKRHDIALEFKAARSAETISEKSEEGSETSDGGNTHTATHVVNDDVSESVSSSSSSNSSSSSSSNSSSIGSSSSSSVGSSSTYPGSGVNNVDVDFSVVVPRDDSPTGQTTDKNAVGGGTSLGNSPSTVFDTPTKQRSFSFVDPTEQTVSQQPQQPSSVNAQKVGTIDLVRVTSNTSNASSTSNSSNISDLSCHYPSLSLDLFQQPVDTSTSNPTEV